jgi:AMMECR1 domain-containing protein
MSLRFAYACRVDGDINRSSNGISAAGFLPATLVVERLPSIFFPLRTLNFSGHAEVKELVLVLLVGYFRDQIIDWKRNIMNISPENDSALLAAARAVLVGSEQQALRWRAQAGAWVTGQLLSGTFVTAYKRLPPTSQNVWCCMSNGEYDGVRTVFDNLLESARICATRDSRRTPGTTPNYVEVTVLAPRKRWRHVQRSDLSRDRGRAISVSVNGQSAIFLPSVWNEEPQWTPEVLIQNLAQKAAGAPATGSSIQVFEIPVYVVSETAQTVNAGYFELQSPRSIQPIQGLAKEILMDASRFYWAFVSDDSRLAYLVTEVPVTEVPVDGSKRRVYVQYDNEGAAARTYGDVDTLFRLSQALTEQQQQMASVETLIAKVISPAPSIDDASAYAFWTLLVLDVYSATLTSEQLRPLAESILQLQHQSPGVFVPDDLQFANPQMMLVLGEIVSLLVEKSNQAASAATQRIVSAAQTAFKGFVQFYSSSKTIGAFAANWILQALAANYTSDSVQAVTALARRLVDECSSALRGTSGLPRSVTLEACALDGWIRFARASNNLVAPPPTDLVLATLQKWRDAQKQWGLGGFRYYYSENWYRTDVTSHVVDVCLEFLL